MFNHPFALEVAYIAVEEAIRLGASYADARFEFTQHEDVTTRNGVLTHTSSQSDRGLGVRAMVRGSWGFAAVSEPTRHDVALAARRAVDFARAASIVQERAARLVDQRPQRSIYRTSIKRDPLAVPLEDKVALLLDIDEVLRKTDDRIVLRAGTFSAHRQRKILVNSEGSEIDQELVWTGVGYQAGAAGDGDFQVRSFPGGPHGTVRGMGWELVTQLDLAGNAERVAQEAVALLSAPPCPTGEQTVVLSAQQAGAQAYRTAGQLMELDRVLDLCQSEASGSFLTVDGLGSLEVGSDKVSISSDASEAFGAGTFEFDDEGVEAQNIELVKAGRLVGYLSGRETAWRVGFEGSHGAMRAGTWADVPTIRMTNVRLHPGDAQDLDALLADTGSGILFDTSRGFIVDGQGNSFLAPCEVAWEIKDGKRGQMYKNAAYRGSVESFWKKCNAVCSEKAYEQHGLASYAKGSPKQRIAFGFGAAPARFVDVSVTDHTQVGASLEAQSTLVFANGDAETALAPRTRKTKRRGSKRKKRKARKKDTK